jgi:uncharacterized damage-inducible protein DinB
MGTMEGALLESFRHNTWATRRLIESCRDLTEEQLAATAPGTFGTVIRTIRHIVVNEGWLMSLLTGELPSWADVRTGEFPSWEDVRGADLDRLDRAAVESAAFWERLAVDGFDLDRPVHDYQPERDESIVVPASVITTLVPYHGAEHRAQVCTLLTTIGVEPPELDAWGYAKAAGRYRVEPGPPPKR